MPNTIDANSGALLPIDDMTNTEKDRESLFYLDELNPPSRLAFNFDGPYQQRSEKIFRQAADTLGLDLPEADDDVGVVIGTFNKDDSDGKLSDVNNSSAGLAVSNRPNILAFNEEALDHEYKGYVNEELHKTLFYVGLHELTHYEQMVRGQKQSLHQLELVAPDVIQLRANNLSYKRHYMELDGYSKSLGIINFANSDEFPEQLKQDSLHNIKAFIDDLPAEHRVDALNSIVSGNLGTDYVNQHFSDYYQNYNYPIVGPIADSLNSTFVGELPVVGGLLSDLASQQEAEVLPGSQQLYGPYQFPDFEND